MPEGAQDLLQGSMLVWHWKAPSHLPFLTVQAEPEEVEGNTSTGEKLPWGCRPSAGRGSVRGLGCGTPGKPS